MTGELPLFVFGRDARLLETRRWVLERAGFKVRTTTEPEQAEQLAQQRDIGLFILCHSLSSHDCSCVLAAARARFPPVKLLLLTAGDPSCSAHPNDTVLSASDGPQALIGAVRSALIARPTPPASPLSVKSQRTPDAAS